MDSIAQFVLGAAIGAAVSGRQIGLRKAAIIGGVLGTLPDLDTFYPFENPVDSFVLHRGATHSLIVHTVLAPIAGFVLSRQFKFGAFNAVLMVWLAWTTHALLDAMTIYGTRLLWPLDLLPFGVGSLFIIDPVYTLPLLAAFFICLFHKNWSAGAERIILTSLILSTTYAIWSIGGQSMAEARAKTWLSDRGIEYSRILTTPLPFNTAFWRVIALEDRHYVNVYVPLLGGPEEVHGYRHKRLDGPGACALGLPEGQRLKQFAKGFVKALTVGDSAVVSDLRMGVTPNYVFNFAVATYEGSALGSPIAIRPVARTEKSDWAWLYAGILGTPGVRKAEQDYLIRDGNQRPASQEEQPLIGC